MPDCLWNPRLSDLELSSGDVHVWCASLNQKVSRLDILQHTLSADEIDRAERFYFQKDREHFIVARGVLRAILGHYLDMAPDQLHFCYGPGGKPALVTTSRRDRLCFNLSHAHGLVLYAVAKDREVGIDLERLRLLSDAEQIAARFFSPRENAVFRALPLSDKQSAFFNCWTRKEAYIKAIGDGLARPLDQFEVSLRPGEPASLVSVKGDAQETRRWCLRELTPAPGYVAAIAVRGHGWHLSCWHWLGTPVNLSVEKEAKVPVSSQTAREIN